MRIATWNVNSVRRRLPHLLQWLEETKPDVACLQELKTSQGDFETKDIQALGYGVAYVGQKSWNGVAMLVKGADPVVRHATLPGDASDEQARYIEAQAHGVVVGGLYLPNGNPQPGPKFDYKLKWMARLHEHAAALATGGTPAVLCGDFNVVPTDEDIYDPKNWRKDALLQPESRAAYQALLDQGWTDSIRALHPTERIYTFWDYMRNRWARDAGLRIDHLLVNAALRPRLKAAGVDRNIRALEGASDHAPVWIELTP